jgi:hypothetical protein
VIPFLFLSGIFLYTHLRQKADAAIERPCLQGELGFSVKFQLNHFISNNFCSGCVLYQKPPHSLGNQAYESTPIPSLARVRLARPPLGKSPKHPLDQQLGRCFFYRGFGGAVAHLF